MPRTKRPKPLYQRGPFALYRRADRPNLEIVWYDGDRKRERSTSAGTADVGQGRDALDRRYLEAFGKRFCPTCNREMDGDSAPLLVNAIMDYLLKSEGKAGHTAAKGRLGHVVEYVAATNPAITLPMVTDQWVEGFRAWLLARPVISPKGKVLRPRAIGHVEGCVLQLAAVINGTHGHKAAFKAMALKEAARSPVYRADVETLAAMFRFCLDPQPSRGQRWTPKIRQMALDGRANLLRFLRIAVATWAREDAIFDVTDRQWHSSAGVLDLNPPNRRQTKKYRPAVPIARQFKPWLDDFKGNYMPVRIIRQSWEKMRAELGLPKGGEAGMKLIRRSMATLARRRIGEANWQQGEMMLGHRKTSTSDIYALPDPANLGLALAATEAIIDEIEALTPGAFYRNLTASTPNLHVVKGAANG